MTAHVSRYMQEQLAKTWRSQLPAVIRISTSGSLGRDCCISISLQDENGNSLVEFGDFEINIGDQIFLHAEATTFNVTVQK